MTYIVQNGAPPRICGMVTPAPGEPIELSPRQARFYLRIRAIAEPKPKRRQPRKGRK